MLPMDPITSLFKVVIVFVDMALKKPLTKPPFQYNPQSIESLKTLLKTQSISVNTEKVESGQAGQIKNVDLTNSENILIQENTRGCRLAWSRLVDLGSIDSGSNPGSPTIVLNLELESVTVCSMDLVPKS
jgi:hypothetical protein